MKGIIMTFFSDQVIRENGLATWQQMLDSTGLDGVYTAGGNYPDQDLIKLIVTYSEIRGESVAHLIHHTGRRLLDQFSDSYGVFFDGHKSFFSFLESVEGVIHVEVKKLYPDVELPNFEYERVSAQQLNMHYRSKRKLCDLALGLVTRAAEFFDVNCSVVHGTHCLNKGDDFCQLEIVAHD